MAMSLGGGKPRADINMTPMIDVLLVLIIIFMVITPIAPRGLEALIPQTSQNQSMPEPEDNLILSVLNDGSLRINQEKVTWATLQPRLSGILRTRGNRVVFVRGEPGIEFEPVGQAIDLAKEAGASRIGLMGW